MDAIIVTGVSAEEIAALAVGLRERRIAENYVSFDVIRESVQKAMSDIEQAGP